MPIYMIDRRRVLLGIAATGGAALLPVLPAAALTQGQARSLIDSVMADIHGIINSGGSEGQMIARFEGLFDQYGDVPIIARSVLGPPARSASASQMQAFTAGFRAYLSRKYGGQFRQFIGATVQVDTARQVQSFWEVESTMTLRGRAPFEVRWHVSDRSGRARFFNLIIEGVNVLAAERQEIGTMLERRGGNLDRMIQDLQQSG
ncbi:MlaC/ttg2D family ABC transporter substrate-binding protein [Pararhodobacter oceanensis]|uniref:ABC transporter n=1 Tax=Pararhodobacter oceanensis TaxID=2172121 RepID=A0A2T8HUZ4_9RHOB|nr:ABC transporter substrate-binding protein [Pararhodobacter oceanensis]PVH29261.1 ABC transporter [Pararhodobacter oceanensis]